MSNCSITREYTLKAFLTRNRVIELKCHTIFLNFLMLFLCIVLQGCAGPKITFGPDVSKIPEKYQTEYLASPITEESSISLHIVSLKKLEMEVKEAIAKRVPIKSITLGNLTNILGYRWNRSTKDFEIIGETGGSAPSILVDQFVSVLRIKSKKVWMSLWPVDLDHLEGMHRVYGYPPEIVDTLYFETLVQSDYFTKSLLMRFIDTPGIDITWQDNIDCKDYKNMSVDDINSNKPSNVFYDLGGFNLGMEKNDNGFTIWIKDLNIIFRHGEDVTNKGVILDAASISRNFGELKELYPIVFKSLENMYKLRLLAQLFFSEKENNAPFDFSYWFFDYPLKPYPTPKKLPGLFIKVGASIKTNARYCAGPQFDYKEFVVGYRLAGGVVINYARYQKYMLEVRYGEDFIKSKSPTKPINGIYISKINNNNYVNLKADNTFFLKEDEDLYEGTYQISDYELILNFNDGEKVIGSIQENSLVDPNFELWIKK